MKNNSSFLNLSEKKVAALPYLILIIYKLFGSIFFMISMRDILILPVDERIYIFLKLVISIVDLIIILFSFILYKIEKQSPLVKSYTKRYMIINGLLPLIVIGLNWIIKDYYLIIFSMYMIVVYLLNIVMVLKIYKTNNTKV